ncbi:MAG: methylated-DNA--[protein]-cysteine S-methyltransferase [Syntrophomonas sp.]|nr:methylated-DNA--[protein]-cysteine S-methyltransferase [Syntrophomonas sp.]
MINHSVMAERRTFMEYICTIPSPLGRLLVVSDGENITGLWIEGQKYSGVGNRDNLVEMELPVFAAVRKWLAVYCEGREPGFLPPLAPQGSPFRQSVWAILLSIPHGQVITYGDIARQLHDQTGGRQSAQAVGGAVGHNPISIIIPCHRVIGANRNLTGYAGGLALKEQLLRLEGWPEGSFIRPTRGTAL